MTRYDETTGLIVVDVQNDFAHADGSLSVEGGTEIIPFINAEIEAALHAGSGVFYTRDWHPPVTPHFEKDGGIWPVHCVAGTWGAELHPDLRVAGPIAHKGAGGEDGYSGFTMRDHESGETRPTELDDLLAAAGVKRLVVVGLATDYCVLATVLDARARDYPTTVLAAGVRPVELQPGDGQRALAEMRAAGAEVEEAATAEGGAD